MNIAQKNFVVGVLFGGRSSEHEVSIRSAVLVIRNLPTLFRILPIGISRTGELFAPQGTFSSTELAQIDEASLAAIAQGQTPALFQNAPVGSCTVLPLPETTNSTTLALGTTNSVRILNRDVHCFFPVLHGPNGEDGRWQGVFELAEIPYVGCDLRASVLGIDKDIQKRLARDAGIPIAKYECISTTQWATDPQSTQKIIEASLGYPCFVKPNALGSAVGTGIARDAEQLTTLMNHASQFDTKILVEELLDGSEIELAFMGSPEAPFISSVAGEIVTEEFYSYEEKYAATSQALLRLPAHISNEQLKQLRSFSLGVVQALGLYGLSRIDFRLTSDERLLFNEVNTLPGMTSISMFPKLMEHDGVGATAWLGQLVEGALARPGQNVSFAVK